MQHFRRGEIGIRKTIGAGKLDIAVMLSRDFLGLTGLALLIAMPAAGWFLSGWLHSFVYRAPLTASIFLFTALAILLLTALSIGWQCLRAASLNPIKALRRE